MDPSVLVLVVEDEPSILTLLEDALGSGGFAVTLAASGEEAIAMLDRPGADYRALITDIALSGRITGWEVARHAREINSKLPIIYTTGSHAHDWASKGVPNSQLLQKPFAAAQVVIALSQLINSADTIV